MTHISEDDLLRYALEVVASDEERTSVAAHLAVCSECRTRLEKLERDIEVIGSVRPRPGLLHIPHQHSRQVSTYAILRAAALVVVGVLVGLGASNWVSREPVFVAPAYITLSAPTDSLTSYSVSDATDISVNYYKQLLEQQE